MYQMVSFKNRISWNHISNSSPKDDVNQVPFSTFLPSAEDQSTLTEELIILVGHVWANHISFIGPQNIKKDLNKLVYSNSGFLVFNNVFYYRCC